MRLSWGDRRSSVAILAVGPIISRIDCLPRILEPHWPQRRRRTRVGLDNGMGQEVLVTRRGERASARFGTRRVATGFDAIPSPPTILTTSRKAIQ